LSIRVNSMSNSMESVKCSEQFLLIQRELSIKQTDMAKAAGISRQSMHSFMKTDGNSEPKFSHIQQLGQTYGIDMNWLFYGTGNMFLPDASQTTARHLRLTNAQNIDGSQPEDLPELTINTYDDAKSCEAQLRLIDKVCEVMKENEASKDMINKAVLAIISK